MTELDPEVQRLFTVARAAYSPDEARVARVGAAVTAAIAVPGTAGAATVGTAAARGAALLGKAKLIAIVAVTAGVGAVAVVASRSASAPDATRPAVAARAVPAAPAPRTIAERVEPASEAPAPTALAEPAAPAEAPRDATRPVSPPDPRRATPAEHVGAAAPSARSAVEAAKIVLVETPDPAPEKRAPARPPVSPPDGAGDSLKGEITLVQQARAALDSGNAARALGVLEEHAAHYPGGALAQERLALQTLAYCALGRTAEARRTVHRLETTWPHSPHLERLRASCAASVSVPRGPSPSVSVPRGPSPAVSVPRGPSPAVSVPRGPADIP